VRWLAALVLAALVALGVVLATRTPQQATQVASPLVGRTAPQVGGSNLVTGSPVSLQAWRGRFVVVNFFASWCVPCRQEAPDLSRFAYQQSHRGNGAQLLSVVFHDTTDTATAFLRSNGDLWPAVSDPGGAVADRYGVTAPPTTFVIDPSGRVAAVLVGPATQDNLDSSLASVRATWAAGARTSHG
jgi:cytochrome c biogenesis protein CcmG/thiol:disulfide interchange protein DsbE